MVTKQPLIDARVSPEAADVIKQLLISNPKVRLCSKHGIEELKEMVFFKDTPWEGLMKKEIPMPFSPKISSSTDVSSFESIFTNETPVDSVSEKSRGDKSAALRKGILGLFGFGFSRKGKNDPNTGGNTTDLNASFADFTFTRDAAILTDQV